MVDDKFRQFLEERYPIVKLKFPGEGRRKWHLRTIEDFWSVSEVQAEIASTALKTQIYTSHYDDDDDPLDELTEGEGAGLLLRTDFSDDAAWNQFVQKVQDSEKDIVATMRSEEGDEIQSANDVEMVVDGSDSESETMPTQIIKVIARDDSLFNGISNLTALRLLNDVGIRLAHPPPTDVNRVNSRNRLVNRNGLQEIYTGKTIWIYDGRSNIDESARLVSQQGDVYGTATGDSWRARASHIPELQFNTSYCNMKIDFGGLDRWDQSERARNLDEAENH